MDENINIINSPLEQAYCADGHCVSIHIYRTAQSDWHLEIEDESGTSTVWDDTFETDKEALEQAIMAIKTEGIGSFISSNNEDEKSSNQEFVISGEPNFEPPSKEIEDMFTPLSISDMKELDQFLLYGVDNDDGMTLEILDGYLHAIAMGPQTIMPSQWLPKVWGEDSNMMPKMDNIAHFNRILGLIMRHYNSIIYGFEHIPPIMIPMWGKVSYPFGEFDQAENWAYGFTLGVDLNRSSWKPLFDSPQGQQWYRPIGLLGENDFCAEQDELTRTPEMRELLGKQIEKNLVNILTFWQPLRQAIHEREMSKHLQAKIGRNEPCPCGSGKKFKKCCGLAAELH